MTLKHTKYIEVDKEQYENLFECNEDPGDFHEQVFGSGKDECSFILQNNSIVAKVCKKKMQDKRGYKYKTAYYLVYDK